MGFHHRHGLRYYQFDLFHDQPIFHAVLTRRGGCSQAPFDSLNTGGTVGDDPEAVLENHRLIYHKLGFPFDSRFDVWQVHGTRILSAVAPRPVGAPHSQADGILTDKIGITLFMRFADCVPLLFFDPHKQVIGIAHAGWQGTSRKIARQAVVAMGERYGSRPGDILAAIGPSICQECYPVGDEVFQAFLDGFGANADRFFDHRGDARYLDLWQANQVTLREAGVSEIETAGLCTACHLEDWYSHRAERGRTGRFGVLLTLGEYLI
jgi:YfiH family protein